jgi:hypothetical protein
MIVKDLSQRCTLVKVTIKKWSGRKLDDQLATEVQSKHQSSADFKVSKPLVDVQSLKDMKTHSEHVRRAMKEWTLPWDESGWRLLPMSAFTKCDEAIKDAKLAFDSAADQFVVGYGEAVDEARLILNTAFNEGDYPSKDDIRDKFVCEVEYQAVPDTDDIRVKASKDALAAIEASVNEKLNQRLNDAVLEPATKVVDLVGNLADALRNYGQDTGNGGKRDIYNATINHVVDLAEALPHLNLTNDPALTRAAKRIMDDIAPYSRDQLKSDPDLRDKAADAAEDVAEMASIFLSGGGKST